jgi:hypothetical protein
VTASVLDLGQFPQLPPAVTPAPDPALFDKALMQARLDANHTKRCVGVYLHRSTSSPTYEGKKLYAEWHERAVQIGNRQAAEVEALEWAKRAATAMRAVVS